MLDVKNPEIRVDEIMQRIQEKVRLRRTHEAPAQVGTAAPATAVMPDSWLRVEEALAQARGSAQIGLAMPPMSRTHGLKRAIASPFAKMFLRLAQLITRDQRAFNQAILSILEAFSERIVSLDVRSARTAQDLSREAGRLASLTQQVTALGQRVGDLDARLRSQTAAHDLSLGQVRTSMTLQERRTTLLLEEANKRLPQPFDQKQLQSFARELPGVSDASYLNFEEEFRGTREEIKQRVAIYVPRLREAEAGTENAPIVDLGCGRGELLEVLKGEGLVSWGIDSNSAAVDQCRQLALDVRLGDAFELLGQIPDGSLGGLVALHVVEHLPFPLLLKLLAETVRVLQPGGIAIFETPNPQNILVGATSFYIDPTHRNPVHPRTLCHLVETHGMVRVETLMLHPFPEEMHVPEGDSAMARLFNQFFFGPQDYAVLGRRP